MTDPGSWAALASQGGFAVLAGFMGWLAYKMWEQAGKLLDKALETLSAVGATSAMFAASIDSLKNEVGGLRREIERWDRHKTSGGQ